MLSTALVTALDTFLKDFEDEPQLELSKKHFTEDPLVLTVAAHRRWTNQETSERWPTSLDSVPATPNDRAVAKQIREYYKNKILIRKLKTAEITQFYQDLYGIVTESTAVYDKHMGMLYRLPYLYYEDLERDQLQEYFNSKNKLNLAEIFVYEPACKQLTSVRTLLQSRRHGDRVEFWFEASDASPVLITVDTNNPLVDLMHSIFDNGSITMSGYYKPTAMRGYDDFVFYNLIRPSLAKRIR